MDTDRVATDDEFLRLLRCPITGDALRLLSGDGLQALNQAITGRSVYSQLGKRVDLPVEGALINHIGSWAYRIQDQIPQLLVSEAISVDSLTLPTGE